VVVGWAHWIATTTEVPVSHDVWAGIDAGKIAHHCVVINDAGAKLLSRKVSNDEADLLRLIEDVAAIADSGRVQWAVDLNAGGAALLITLLVEHELDLVYIPGRTVHHASAAYRGDGKTDAKDAAVIADQARMRRDLRPFRQRDEITVDLRLLCARRTDLAMDRNRAIARLRSTLLEYFPALERAFDYAHRRGALTLLTRFQTSAAIRQAGPVKISAWLRRHGAYSPDTIAQTAVSAAASQRTVVPGQQTAAKIVAQLAQQVIALDAEMDTIEAEITERFRDHAYAPAIESMPGFGPLLGAELLVGINGDTANFENVDRLASIAGPAPVPHDSGRITGNLKRPRRYDRRLLRACYMAAHNSLRTNPESRTFYDRKRATGKRHNQAVLALARRRINVLWALIRDETTYQPVTLKAA
jgi:transposase